MRQEKRKKQERDEKTQQREDRDSFSPKGPMRGDTLQPRLLEFPDKAVGVPGGCQALAGRLPLALNSHLFTAAMCRGFSVAGFQYCKQILSKLCLQLSMASHVSKTYQGREVWCQQSLEAAQEPNATQMLF